MNRINLTSVAIETARANALRPLVVLIDSDAPEDPVGSGTLIKTQRGCAVLTCKHVLDPGWGSLIVRHSSRDEPASRIKNVVVHGRLDLAMAVLADDELEAFAVAPSQLAGPESFPLTPMSPILVVGFPQYMVGDVIDDRGAFLGRTPTHTSYLTTLVGTSSDVLSIHWDLAVPDPGDAWDFSKGTPDDHQFNLRKPAGLSGGAAWTFQPLYDGRGDGAHIGSLVGVPHQFTNKRQLALPSPRWREWVNRVVAAT